MVEMIALFLKFLLFTILCLICLLIAAVFALRRWLQPSKATCRCKVNLKGKVALVTGGNSGIGLEVARDLAEREATVIIASRDVKKSEEAVKDIVKTTGNNKVYYKHLDLAKFSSIKEFAEDFNRSYDRLNILVNNAGCAAIKPGVTEDGIQKVIQINYVGPFLLTNLLIDKLIASKPSRIVMVSSKGNEFSDLNPDDIASAGIKPKNGFQVFRIYANSKLCQILWAKALSKRLPSGVTANSLHPGLVRTDIFNKVPEFQRKLWLIMIDMFFKTAKEGAQTPIHLCVAPEIEGVTGEYFVECEISSAHKSTNDDEMVEKVWENTMMLVKGH